VPKLLIVFDSRTGGTYQMVDAAVAGARTEAAVQTTRLPSTDAHATDLIDADGFVFAAPENLAAMTGRMKDFFDRTYYGALDQLNGRPYATMICAGSDGTNAVRQIARIALGWRLRPVAEPLIICTRAQSADAILRPKTIEAADLQRCTELGAAMAVGLAAGIF
jgi:multimeric flavodoxin WrbA